MAALLGLCRTPRRQATVPTTSLESFLDLVFGTARTARSSSGPSADDADLLLPGQHAYWWGGGALQQTVAVEYVKVDAQGYDLECGARGCHKGQASLACLCCYVCFLVFILLCCLLSRKCVRLTYCVFFC